MLKIFLNKKDQDKKARVLYDRLVDQARSPVFYESLGVPDTLDGRFDLVALHCFLLLRRLKQAQPPEDRLSQALYDTFFADLDHCLREMGVGDLSVGRKVRTMAEAFSGRMAAYETALGESGGDLEAALRRNLYGTVEVGAEEVRSMADYVRGSDRRLGEMSVDEVLASPRPFAGADH